MKLKSGFVLRELGDSFVAVSINEEENGFHGIVRLNATAVDIWNGLEAGKSVEEIAVELVDKYDGVDIPRATECVNNVVKQFDEAGFLDYE